MDIDHFKQVNDTYGHLAGDKVLRAVAELLTGHMRGYDMASRFGGEEFAVLLPGLAAEKLGVVAERIRTQTAALAVPAATHEVRVTVSIGVAVHPTNGDTPTELLAAADHAMYAAKRAGRNRVRFAPPAHEPDNDPKS